MLVSGITWHHPTHLSPTDTPVSYNQLHKGIFTKTSSLGGGSIFNLKRRSVRHHASNNQSFNLLHGFSTIALVTGRGTGVGKVITGALDLHGCNVCIAAHKEAFLKDTMAEFNKARAGKVEYIIANINVHVLCSVCYVQEIKFSLRACRMKQAAVPLSPKSRSTYQRSTSLSTTQVYHGVYLTTMFWKRKDGIMSSTRAFSIVRNLALNLRSLITMSCLVSAG